MRRHVVKKMNEPETEQLPQRKGQSVQYNHLTLPAAQLAQPAPRTQQISTTYWCTNCTWNYQYTSTHPVGASSPNVGQSAQLKTVIINHIAYCPGNQNYNGISVPPTIFPTLDDIREF